MSLSAGGVIGRSVSTGCVLKMVDGDVSFFLSDSILLGVPGPSPSSCLVLNIDLSLLDLGDSSVLWSVLPVLPASIDNLLGRVPSDSDLVPFPCPFPFSDPRLIREMIEGIVLLPECQRSTPRIRRIPITHRFKRHYWQTSCDQASSSLICKYGRLGFVVYMYILDTDEKRNRYRSCDNVESVKK